MSKTMTALPGIGIRHYRSFDGQGFFIKELKRFNVFIGRNNSGKSNILNAIELLSRLQHPPAGGGIDAKHDKNHKTNGSIAASISFPTDAVIPAECEPRQKNWALDKLGHSLEVTWEIASENIVECNQLKRLTDADLHRLFPIITRSAFRYQEPRRNYEIPIGSALVHAAIRALKSSYANVLQIPVFRQIGDEEYDPKTRRSFNGADVIQRLRMMQNPDVGADQMREAFDKIEAFTGSLLHAPDLKLEVPSSKLVLNVQMHGLPRLPLSSFGTGVHHLILLCAAASLHPDGVVLLEEPEIHLHPDLQRALVRFLLKETRSTYFVTTHSNVFLDVGPEVAVFRVTHDGAATRVHSVELPTDAREILTDMGYKASDLLQSNGVVWVEGPSDRIYVKQWLKLVDPDLDEGMHFSIAFYGGKLLAHLTMEDDPVEDLIKVLCINRHAAVIFDRDGDDDSAALNRSKDRIRNELIDGICWVTKGREIENYLPADLIRRSLESKYPAVSGIKFNADAKLSKQLEGMDGGPSRFDKVAFARLFVKNMGSPDLKVLDLEEQVRGLAGLIRAWNRLDSTASK